MSSLWTPDGERSVPPASTPPSSVPADAPEHVVSPEEMAELDAELREMTEGIVSVPATAIVSNHCVGLFQLAAAHLQVSPPNLDDARLSIDALAAVVTALKGRLGPDEPTLVDALAQIRMAYVQVSSTARAE